MIKKKIDENKRTEYGYIDSYFERIRDDYYDYDYDEKRRIKKKQPFRVDFGLVNPQDEISFTIEYLTKITMDNDQLYIQIPFYQSKEINLTMNIYGTSQFQWNGMFSNKLDFDFSIDWLLKPIICLLSLAIFCKLLNPNTIKLLVSKTKSPTVEFIISSSLFNNLSNSASPSGEAYLIKSSKSYIFDTLLYMLEK